jgi:hypothetical protein
MSVCSNGCNPPTPSEESKINSKRARAAMQGGRRREARQVLLCNSVLSYLL